MADKQVIEITASQTMVIPSGLTLGVQGDNEVKRLYFSCPRYPSDDVDLYLFDTKYFVYITPNGTVSNAMLCQNEAVDGDTLTFDVPVTGDMTKYSGNVGIGLCFKDGELDWNVHNAEILCISGYHVDNPIAQYPDLAQQISTLIIQGGALLTQLQNTKSDISDIVANGNSVIASVENIVKTASESAATANQAVKDIADERTACIEATSAANTAASAADTATESANAAATTASESAAKADEAAEKANTAAETIDSKISAETTRAEAAEKANADTITATNTKVSGISEDISDIRGYLGYTEGHIYGVEVDFINKVFTRLAGAVGLNAGSDFDGVNAFGGRRRCNLADDGTVNAYYGESGYKEDGSNGQVMVEQPMFYYKVVPIKLEKLSNGQMITRKVRYYVSDNFYEGFKIHPAFITNGKICDKIYVSAYEATVYDVSALAYDLTDSISADFSADKICSIAGAKPASGNKNTLTRANLRKLAQNRGSNWAQSLVQTVCMSELLMLIEYAQFNMQDAIGVGNSQRNWLEDETNWAVNTGATASLGNKSGSVTITVAGQTSGAADQQVVTVSYRGEENLWGDIWTWFDGINIKNPNSFGAGNFSEGVYIADHDFADDTSASPYEDSGLRPPYLSCSYISAFCYNFNYDWMFLPGEGNGNSSVPVGDCVQNTNPSWRVALLGGCWSDWADAGPFFWYLGSTSGFYDRDVGGRSVYRKS